ncbi:putative serine dehydratase domain-containing protein [Xylaria bambusicola]|uniref:putative serine dehydratase domain-containing protein n=1 Tax=Xylaria bambusicola TaxID=326684 RepID=UPI002007DD1B|nr:putative serine dehydratase domain-containing protein [Xylaria bambusicola]KAI0521526.1 putative serine dehydratase domain-containing protein [Xylaria bambusicola]
MAATQLSKELLRAQFVGKTLHSVPTPAAVLDLAKVEANCNQMLRTARRLDLNWRAHIKTHKTAELTRLQVGDDEMTPVNIVVSTLAEAENVLPLLKEYQLKGRQVNMLYSFPIYPSSVDRLAAISSQLGPQGLTVMVDHADQIKLLTLLASKAGNPPLVFLKINIGSNRAGVPPDSPACVALVRELLLSETVGASVFWGLYSHAGHSYASREDWAAMGILGVEFGTLHDVARAVQKDRPDHPLVLSVGATPTVNSLHHPDFDINGAAVANGGTNGDSTAAVSQIKDLLARMRADGLTLEIHAGVYPTLDVQQLAAHSCDARYLNPSAIGITVLAEVSSVYPGRGPGGATEALVNAGSLALGREPCEDMGSVKGRHYNGWGIVMPWAGVANVVPGPGFPAVHGGWQVARISQEHGVLAWRGGGGGGGGGGAGGDGGDGSTANDEETPLAVGQRLRIWPNHSCITGAGYPWYLVVDSRNAGREDEIIDVWPRWNGW